MIFILDNFDSFTYNIVQYLQQLGCEVVVRRNNAVTVDEVMAMNPEAIVLSPGPGRPEKAGIMLELIDRAKGRIPLLGICLGHQAIGLAFGGKVVGAKKIMHGKISERYLSNPNILIPPALNLPPSPCIPKKCPLKRSLPQYRNSG